MMARKRDPSKQNEKDTMKVIYKAPMQMIKMRLAFCTRKPETKKPPHVRRPISFLMKFYNSSITKNFCLRKWSGSVTVSTYSSPSFSTL
jgi:hypothetical protein